jgi:hypothetical protein
MTRFESIIRFASEDDNTSSVTVLHDEGLCIAGFAQADMTTLDDIFAAHIAQAQLEMHS